MIIKSVDIDFINFWQILFYGFSEWEAEYMVNVHLKGG